MDNLTKGLRRAVLAVTSNKEIPTSQLGPKLALALRGWFQGYFMVRCCVACGVRPHVRGRLRASMQAGGVRVSTLNPVQVWGVVVYVLAPDKSCSILLLSDLLLGLCPLHGW